MQIHYLEIVTREVDAVCAAYAATNGVQFGDPDAALDNARTAALHGGGMVGVRAPLRATEERWCGRTGWWTTSKRPLPQRSGRGTSSRWGRRGSPATAHSRSTFREETITGCGSGTIREPAGLTSRAHRWKRLTDGTPRESVRTPNRTPPGAILIRVAVLLSSFSGHPIHRCAIPERHRCHYP